MKTFQTQKGSVEGVKLQWEDFSLLIVVAPKGFLACGIFDLDALDRFGKSAGIVESGPDNPIGTLERFMERKVVVRNKGAERLGITCGEAASTALEKMF